MLILENAMNTTNKRPRFPADSTTDASAASLRGKQSVRTTFKLPARSIDALSILATQLGIKQKSLFDHLMDDMQSLQTIVKNFDSYEIPQQPRVPKTYVISRRTLENLERVSRNFQAPRDVVVELCIKQLLPILLREQEKHAQRKLVLNQLQQHGIHGEKIRRAAEEMLGKDDPVYEKIAGLLETERSVYEEIMTTIQKGEAIENFH